MRSCPRCSSSTVDMDSVSGGEDEAEAPLLDAVGSKSRSRDVHILSFAFLLAFSAYSAAQNLESTINTGEDLGTTSLGLLYLSFTLFSVVASPMVKVLGTKRALVLGTTGYWLFIASNLKPSWLVLVSILAFFFLSAISSFISIVLFF